ncbi:MAG: putative toxin-antitoxin system toxin component, PIN family [Phycisphaerales bacterium]
MLDTNVLLAGVFTRGVCEAVLDACIGADAFTLVLSGHILDEFRRHARGKFGATADEVKAALDLLREHAEIVVPSDVPGDVCSDASDLPVIGTAVAGDAPVLVTGDSDLLRLKRFGAVEIITVRQFYDRLLARG